MSGLRYFIGGALTGIAGLAVVAWLHDKHSSEGNFAPSVSERDQELAEAVASTADEIKCDLP